MKIIRVVNHSELYAFDRVLKVSCVVKRRTSGMEVAYSINRDGSRGVPYQPLQFPKSPPGGWRITKVLRKDKVKEPYVWPYFVGTDAHQMIVSLDGKTRAEDWGYGLHFDYLYMTTRGCERLNSAEDATWFAETCLRYIMETLVLEVT